MFYCSTNFPLYTDESLELFEDVLPTAKNPNLLKHLVISCGGHGRSLCTLVQFAQWYSSSVASTFAAPSFKVQEKQQGVLVVSRALNPTQ